MVLDQVILQNFRSYTKAEFTFSKETTVITGPNTAGKSNLIEAIYLLATGKSFRAEKDSDLIQLGRDLGRVKSIVKGKEETKGTQEKTEETKVLEVVITTNPQFSGGRSIRKRYLVNDIPRRRVDFASHLQVLLFSPADLEIIIGSPSLRRNFLDEALESVDREYRLALQTYSKALRSRNALLENVQETGRRNEKLFEYWDELLITNGHLITKKREEFVQFLNAEKKEVIDCSVEYDKSVISEARLLQYKDAEVASGVTLVGPHRDDLKIFLGEYVTLNKVKGLSVKNKDSSGPEALQNDMRRNVKAFGSRGQQRLVVLELKMLELSFREERTGKRPLLLLDDIFSELDGSHIQHVLSLLGKQQTIITTTHEEFINPKILKDMDMIELEG